MNSKRLCYNINLRDNLWDSPFVKGFCIIFFICDQYCLNMYMPYTVSNSKLLKCSLTQSKVITQFKYSSYAILIFDPNYF